MRYWKQMLSSCLLVQLLLSACGDGIDESQVAAKVGDQILLKQEVKLKVPFGMSGADSASYANEYVAKWVDEQLLYQQASKNLPNFKELEEQAERYKYDLICQTYLLELMKQREGAIPDGICVQYYDEYSSQLKLESPILKGFVIQIPAKNSQLKTVKEWLAEITNGEMEHLPELEQFCQQKSLHYDGFLDAWSDMHRLTDCLPIVVVEERDFLKIGVHQIDDEDYSYLYAISDYRLTGEKRPVESALPDIREILMLQRRKELQQTLMQELRSDAIGRGAVKINK